MSGLAAWRRRARHLRRETYALYLACRDPRVPWYARLLAVGIVAYALSPLDLIPDVIPVLGYLDDLVLVPLGIALVLRLIPRAVLDDCRARASDRLDGHGAGARAASAVVVGLWLLGAVAAAVIAARLLAPA